MIVTAHVMATMSMAMHVLVTIMIVTMRITYDGDDSDDAMTR